MAQSSKVMTDTELLDYLQRLNDQKGYTGRCVLRYSTTGRGWRLHETSAEGGCTDVREAIKQFISQAT